MACTKTSTVKLDRYLTHADSNYMRIFQPKNSQNNNLDSTPCLSCWHFNIDFDDGSTGSQAPAVYLFWCYDRLPYSVWHLSKLRSL